MPSDNLVAAVDLGTSKTVVLIADRLPGRAPNIIGFYEQETIGVTQGEVIDIPAGTRAVQHALTEAERIAGVFNGVRRAWFSVSGEHLRGFRRSGYASVLRGKVAPDDMASARRDAARYTAEEDRLVLDSSPGRYFVDGRWRPEPVGAEGRCLEFTRWHVDAQQERLSHLLHIPTSLGMTTERLVPSSLASAVAVTDAAARNQGVLVVDIGAGVTDYALYRGGHLVRTGVVGWGGEHLTLDLSRELQVRHADAESIKRTLSRAYSDADDAKETILFHRGESVIGGKQLKRRKLNMTVEARMGAILTRIRDDLAEEFVGGLPSNGVVLTGGGSRLAGLEVFAERILGMRASVGDFSDETPRRLAEQEYATALGLMHLFSEEPMRVPQEKKSSLSALGRFWREKCPPMFRDS